MITTHQSYRPKGVNYITKVLYDPRGGFFSQKQQHVSLFAPTYEEQHPLFVLADGSAMLMVVP